MARRRRQFKEMEVLESLLLQGAVIPCFRCRVVLTPDDVKGGNVQKEHLHEFGLDGPDEPGNCRFSHCECHKVITHGNGATFAGSSRHKINKTKPKRTEKFKVVKPLSLPPSDPAAPARCSRCGDYRDSCKCPPLVRRSSFGRRG